MNEITTIKKNWEFQKIYRKGRYAVTKGLVVYMYPNHLQKNRIGITASKKYGKSVKRNRIRRLIRESYHILMNELKPGYDLIFVARKVEETEEPGLQQIVKQMRFLFKRLDMLDRN